MLFGANNEKGLVFEDMRLKVVTVGQDGYTLDKILTHDAHTKDTTLHSMLAAMKYPDYPVALGVIRSVEDEIVYDQAVEKQVEEVKAQSKIHCVDDLLHSGATWEILRYNETKKLSETTTIFVSITERTGPYRKYLKVSALHRLPYPL